jgi:hypothetical protein
VGGFLDVSWWQGNSISLNKINISTEFVNEDFGISNIGWFGKSGHLELSFLSEHVEDTNVGNNFTSCLNSLIFNSNSWFVSITE